MKYIFIIQNTLELNDRIYKKIYRRYLSTKCVNGTQKLIHSWDAYNLIRSLLLVFLKVFVWYFSETFTFRSRYTSNYIYTTLSLYPYFSLLFQHHTVNKGNAQCSGVFCFNSTQKYRVNARDIPRDAPASPLKPKTCPQTVNVDY